MRSLLVLACVLTTGTPSPAAERATPEARTEARLVAGQKPTYPREAQLRGMEGEVLLWLNISADGDVLEAKVHRSSGHRMLDDHTLRFARTLDFVPARRGQIAIPTTVLLPVRYRLTDE
jgi:protein TonB